jgi:hypothetical protein
VGVALGVSGAGGSLSLGLIGLGISKAVSGSSSSVSLGNLTLDRTLSLLGLGSTSGLGNVTSSRTLGLTGSYATGQLGNYILGIPTAVNAILYKAGKFQVNLSVSGNFTPSLSSVRKFQTTKPHTGKF